MKISVNELKISDMYKRLYNYDKDISDLVDRLKTNKDNYDPIIIDKDNNVIAGVDTWRAFMALSEQGVKGFDKIRISKIVESGDVSIVTMIESHNHIDCTREELCKAVYMYYESYRKAYPKGHDMYLTGKQLLPYLPNIFAIKKEESKSLLSGKCYEDYIMIGRKIWELEEQGRIEDLECLYVLLNNVSVSTVRHNGFLNQIDSWTDEIRDDIRKSYASKGEFYRRIHRINQKCTNITKNSPQETKSIQDYIDDLHDEERDRSLDDVDLAHVVIDNIRSAFISVKNTVEEEQKPRITIQSKQIACQAIDELKQIMEYITSYFEL